jgi:death-on-curing protein
MTAFLEIEELLEIHPDQIARYGGASGLRDMGLLQSALAMPQAGSGGQYFHADVFEMAAAYLYHIAGNHPFVDGNKRVALAAALTFLALNGVALGAGVAAAIETLVRAVASGNATKADAAAFLRKHGRSRP